MPYVCDMYLFRAARDTTKRIMLLLVRVQVVQIRLAAGLEIRRSSERVRTLHRKFRHCYLGTYDHMAAALDMNTSRRFSYGYPVLPQSSSTSAIV